MFGLTMEKLLLIGVLAAFLIGPQRLPQYAAQLARVAKKAKEFVTVGRDRLRDEMGPEFDDVDWKSLDPRRYDPRSIIRTALTEPSPADDEARPFSPKATGTTEDTAA